MAAVTLLSVDDFKLLFSLAEHGMVPTFFSTVTSCFIRPILLSERLLNSSKSWLNLVPKSLQSDTGPTVVEADCCLILAAGVVELSEVLKEA